MSYAQCIYQSTVEWKIRKKPRIGMWNESNQLFVAKGIFWHSFFYSFVCFLFIFLAVFTKINVLLLFSGLVGVFSTSFHSINILQANRLCVVKMKNKAILQNKHIINSTMNENTKPRTISSQKSKHEIETIFIRDVIWVTAIEIETKWDKEARNKRKIYLISLAAMK